MPTLLIWGEKDQIIPVEQQPQVASEGTLAGLDVDLVPAVAAELGVTAEIREVDFPGMRLCRFSRSKRPTGDRLPTCGFR